MSGNDWASDVPVSLPEPVGVDGPHVLMHGFVFTEFGLFHDLSEADHESLRVPTWAPQDPTTVVYDDGR